MHSAVVQLPCPAPLHRMPALQGIARDTDAASIPPRVISKGTGFSHEITGRPIPKEGKQAPLQHRAGIWWRGSAVDLQGRRPMRKLIDTSRRLSAGRLLIVGSRTTPGSPYVLPGLHIMMRCVRDQIRPWLSREISLAWGPRPPRGGWKDSRQATGGGKWRARERGSCRGSGDGVSRGCSCRHAMNEHREEGV